VPIITAPFTKESDLVIGLLSPKIYKLSYFISRLIL
jgi:hypothetical protein